MVPTKSARSKSKASRLKHLTKIGRAGGEALKKSLGQKYYDKISRKGGKAVQKKYGNKYFAKLRMKRGRQFPPCTVPRPNDPSRRHRFNPKTGICYGCGFDRNVK
ncbi:MAG TPA: hypothetical protein VGO67_17835 [Verrucomicrobiae bacterium]|jgi:general stress protein YciG